MGHGHTRHGQSTPFASTIRLRIQKGVFVPPGAIDATFTPNLESMAGHNDAANLLRIVIPADLIPGILVELFRINITRRSRFPGPDGYAQELGVDHPVFNPNDSLAKAERQRPSASACGHTTA